MKPSSRIVLLAVLALAVVLLPLALKRVSFAGDTDPPLAVSTPGAARPSAPAKATGATMNFASVAAPGRANWPTELQRTEDYHEFVVAALQAVESGDGRAAYFINWALALCNSEIRLARQSSDPEKDHREQYVDGRDVPWMAAKNRLKFKRCIRLATENPFAVLPARGKDYYSLSTWMDVAIELGDPIAKYERAVSLLGQAAGGDPTADKRRELEKAQAYLRDAVRSGEGAVYFGIGMALIDRDYSKDLRGVVLMFAACELGYDCSGRTPLSYYTRCDFPEECSAPEDWRDSLLVGAGGERYAWFYSRAQEVADLVRRGDWEALDAYVTIDGRLGEKYDLPGRP